MASAQSGIFAAGTSSHCFLEFASRPETAALELVQALADLEEPHTTVGGVNLVLGVRPTIWTQVAPDKLPVHASDFDEPIRGVGGFTMPATQQDAWVWVSGAAPDLVFDVCVDIVGRWRRWRRWRPRSTGWSYRHSRDLTGFEDGTENPSLAQAPAVALVPAGQPGEGSSVVLVQEWIHHAEAWNALDVTAQEQVMGRSKADSVELDEDTQPENSHVSRTVIEDEAGQELPIFRRNVPHGTPTNYGTMFVGFSYDPPRLQRILNRMAGAEDGTRDALTRYTTPVTGAYYIVPAIDHLAPLTTPEP